MMNSHWTKGTMQRLSLFIASLTACLLAVTIAQALTVAYGRRDIAEAGAGCVGGWISGHGKIAYFRGDTELLNLQLTLLATGTAEHRPAKVVLHTGKKLVDDPNEQPVTEFGDQERNQLAIDWSVRRSCPSDDVLAGRCKCDRRIVTVNIWIANDIHLDTLSIPTGLAVESGREIEQYIERHTDRK